MEGILGIFRMDLVKSATSMPKIKKVEQGGLMLMHILTNVLEPVARGIKNSGEVTSTEHHLNKFNTLNQEWEAGGLPPGEMPTLIAADAEALYPLLDPNICTRVVREETLKSDLEVDGNWQEMTRYLAMSSNPWEWKQWKVDQFIPRRAFS